MKKTKTISNKFKDMPDPEVILSDWVFWDSFRKEMVEFMTAYAQGVAMGAAAFNVSIGLRVNMDLVNQQVLAFSRTYADQWWLQLEQTTRDELRKAITAWQQGGLGDKGLPDLIDQIEPLFGEERASLIAETEVTRIFDRGNQLAHISAGIEEEEWQTANDDIVCMICGPLDGNIYPVNSGPRPVTDTHPRCRCVRVPVANNPALRG